MRVIPPLELFRSLTVNQRSSRCARLRAVQSVEFGQCDARPARHSPVRELRNLRSTRGPSVSLAVVGPRYAIGAEALLRCPVVTAPRANHRPASSRVNPFQALFAALDVSECGARARFFYSILGSGFPSGACRCPSRPSFQAFAFMEAQIEEHLRGAFSSVRPLDHAPSS